MSHSFALTYDYLCPFARIVNETVVDAIETGVPWDVEFRPFSLAQVHVEDGETAAWDLPDDAKGRYGLDALYWSIAIKDHQPDRFLAFHRAMFSARHDDAADIADVEVIAGVAAAQGIDVDVIRDIVAGGEPAKTLAAAHTEAVTRWDVFGVPTFIVGDDAVFVRLMERGRIDDVQRVLDTISWTRLNEFKHTRIPQ